MSDFLDVLPKDYLKKINEINEILKEIIPLEKKLNDYGIYLEIKENIKCLNTTQ